MTNQWRAVDERWAARHGQILNDLVMVFALAAAHNSNFVQAVKGIPASQTASGVVFDGDTGTGSTSGALLRDLVTGMRHAAELDPVVARLFSKKGWSAWSIARCAVADGRQWQRVPNTERLHPHRAPSATEVQPRPPASPSGTRSGSGRRL